MTTTTFDLVIVGAGLIGASLAVCLQRQGLKIALLEKHLPDFTHSATHDERPISLALGSKKILTTLGLWSELMPRARAIEEVQVAEAGVLGAVHFKAQELAVEALGFVVPYFLLYRTVYQAAANIAGVEIIPIENLSEIKSTPEGATLLCQTATGSKEFTTKLVIGCDGARSRVRELTQIRAEQEEQAEIALTAKIEFDEPYPAIALERFSRQGVVALLPLQQQQTCGLVWTMPASQHQQMNSWSSEELIRNLTELFRHRLPPIKQVKLGSAWPLQTIFCKKPYHSSVLLLGNAAHTIYPLAAQGFNLGLRDVAVLAEILIAAHHAEKSLGTDDLLASYCKERSKDQARILRLTNTLTRVFSSRLPLLASMRGFGMLMLDMATPLKTEFAKLTMGLSGRLPKLVRGIPLWQE